MSTTCTRATRSVSSMKTSLMSLIRDPPVSQLMYPQLLKAQPLPTEFIGDNKTGGAVEQIQGRFWRGHDYPWAQLSGSIRPELQFTYKAATALESGYLVGGWSARRWVCERCRRHYNSSGVGSLRREYAMNYGYVAMLWLT